MNRNKITLVVCFLCAFVYTKSQDFQSPMNPYYWKNKKPAPNYWQQDIDYKIKAYLDEKNEVISGIESIKYTNNSPDTLYHLFFNLYQNAFIENSYLTNLQEANGSKIQYGKWEKANLGNEIKSLKINGNELKREIDGSIMKVWLAQPMLPNTEIVIELQFNTYYSKGGATRRRMKSFVQKGQRHFNGAHWYPRLAVYDRKFKWCTDQHLNREFYGDFGNYEVELNFPANFVVEATGEIQNENDVMPKELRNKLDLSNYWKNKWDSDITFEQKIQKGARKTWKYKARNVHDFAWIAGPLYRIHESIINNVKVVAMVLEHHASGWKNATEFTHKVIHTYSRDFGKYAYPKMIVADCEDGMEYPMLTMDGGSDPGYRKLLAHEVGHNWFYGMVNNNETYRAMLDEGFTQFLTVWAMERIDGKYVVQSKPTNKYLNKHFEEVEAREANVYLGYMRDAVHNEDPTLNTHSDGFNGALGQGGGYGHVYSKTATMLFNLQYVLGDSLFSGAMKHYFNQWSFCHPYIEDFRQSIIDYTKRDLNWFFDQWIETSKHIDYKFVGLDKLDSGNLYELKLKRKGEMQMPIDLTITGKSGKKYNFYIPNTWFEKETGATRLPRWIGWDSKLKTDYSAKIELPETVQKVEIDTTRRLADIRPLNNNSYFPIKFKFDHKLYDNLDRNYYHAFWRPDVWYNNFDGVKLGVHFNGNYMRSFHNMQFDFWVNTGLGKGAIRENNFGHNSNDIISYRFNYSTPTHSFIKNSTFSFHSRWLDGIVLNKIGLSKPLNDYFSASLFYKMMMRPSEGTDNYHYDPNAWGNGGLNSNLNAEIYYSKLYKSNIYHQSKLAVRASILSYNNYNFIENEHIFKKTFYKFLFKARFYGRLGVNEKGNNGLPNASLLEAGNANMEQMIENEFTRSVFLIPSSMYDFNNLGLNASNLNMAGGLNMRGYTMRSFIEDGNSLHSLKAQNSGYSANLQIHFERLSPIKFRRLSQTLGLELYSFADMGKIGTALLHADGFAFNASPMLFDAGLGAGLQIKKFGVLQTVKPLYFRFDMPLFLSSPNREDNHSQFKFRWLLGIEKVL